jgi:hypothetical protein
LCTASAPVYQRRREDVGARFIQWARGPTPSLAAVEAVGEGMGNEIL